MPSSILLALVFLVDGISTNPVNGDSILEGCGVRMETKTRIVGGQTSFPGNWPWMAALYRGKSQYCAGALISDRHILTAAHCVSGVNPQMIRVRLGDLKRDAQILVASLNITTTDTLSEEGSVFQVERVVIHRDYQPASHLHDIAVLRLNQSAKFGRTIGRICLPPPTPKATFEAQQAIVAGWGTMEYHGSSSPYLREVEVPVWSNPDCLTAMGHNIYDTSLCAGGREKSADACQGDSGGPLMLQMADERWAAIGVVSWGVRCGDPTKPGVYTRITHYTDWILSAVQTTY